MKSITNLLHRTPWWALLGGGLVVTLALATFATPFHLIGLQKSGATPEENRAIKREIDLTFGEGAVDLAHGIVRGMRDKSRDPARRAELDRALEEIEGARETLREAGAEVLRSKREAADEVSEAVREAAQSLEEAQREADRVLRQAGVDDPSIRQSLDESLAAARRAEAEARRAAAEARRERAVDRIKRSAERLRASKPTPESAPGTSPEAPAATPDTPPANAEPEAEKQSSRIVIMSPNKRKPILDIDVGPSTLGIGPGGRTPLPPEVRAQIREKVSHDLWRIGIGAGLILLFIPLFIITVVSKFFIDRSRAAQRMAELHHKEAEYHRMSQQVTEAKLSALQAQVEPHFLYNTLASVQALTEVDPQQANAMTGHLIQYLRNALPKMRESVSTVGQEVELVRAYLNILQMRMGKRLVFDIAVPAELMELPFPPLMLPSLVENAIKHGLEPQREGGEVRISATLVEGKLRMIVADTGKGFAEAPGAGVGLANIRERLAAMYGPAATLTLVAQEPKGVVATIEVPRDGARATASPPGTPPPTLAAQPEARSRTQKTLYAMGTAERAWRRGLSFTFVVLVVIAAVMSGLAILGVMTGVLPVRLGESNVGSAGGALIGTAGIAAAFAVMVLGLAIVLAVIYGLGFLFVGMAIFIPLMVLVSLFPVLAPFLLVGLAIWWFVRRRKRKAADEDLDPPTYPPGV